MKNIKIFLITIVLFTIINTVNAQSNLDVTGQAILRHNTPRLTLFDLEDDRNEFILEEGGNDILLNSLRGNLEFGTGLTGGTFPRVTILGSNGNVGIGTTQPLHKLHIVGDRLRITSPSNVGKFIDFRTDGGALDIASTGGKLFLVGNDGEGVIIQQAAGNVAIGNDTSPDAKLDVVGDIHYTGSITDVSDIRLKENMVPLENSIDRICRLNGFVYNLIGETERNAGVSAQQVQNVLPEAVSEIDDGYLGVDYTQLVPLLIEGIKEHQLEIIALKYEMSEIRKLLKSQAGRSASEK